MDAHNKKINNNSFSNNNKKNLIILEQNKNQLSIKIENYFSKSKLESIEISYEKKIVEVKDLLMKFHLLYNSLNKIKTDMIKENYNKNFTPINTERNHKEKIFLIIKKSNINSFNNKINVLSGIKNEEKDNYKNNSKNKLIKSYKIKTYKKNKIINTNLNINNFINEKLKSKKVNDKKIVRNINNKIYSFTSKNNEIIKKTNTYNYIIQSKAKFNTHKTTSFNAKKCLKIKSNNKDKNNQSKKRLTFSLKTNQNNFSLNTMNSSKTIKRNYNKFLNKNINYKRNRNFNLDGTKTINLTDENKNFSSENILFLSRLNLEDTHNFNISNNNIIRNQLSKLKEKEIKHKINKSYKFEQRYTLRNNNIRNNNVILKNKSLINNRICKKSKISDFNFRNNSNILFTKEKRNRQLKKTNIFFLFLTDNKNYNILKKIYNYLYINENIKEGYNNYLKNIKGPFRDIYLNKCLSETQKQLDKFEDKNIEKDDDVWTIMEKEILINKLNKINKYIENNNCKI